MTSLLAVALISFTQSQDISELELRWHDLRPVLASAAVADDAVWATPFASRGSLSWIQYDLHAFEDSPRLDVDAALGIVQEIGWSGHRPGHDLVIRGRLGIRATAEDHALVERVFDDVAAALQPAVRAELHRVDAALVTMTTAPVLTAREVESILARAEGSLISRTTLAFASQGVLGHATEREVMTQPALFGWRRRLRRADTTTALETDGLTVGLQLDPCRSGENLLMQVWGNAAVPERPRRSTTQPGLGGLQLEEPAWRVAYFAHSAVIEPGGAIVHPCPGTPESALVVRIVPLPRATFAAAVEGGRLLVSEAEPPRVLYGEVEYLDFSDDDEGRGAPIVIADLLWPRLELVDEAIRTERDRIAYARVGSRLVCLGPADDVGDLRRAVETAALGLPDASYEFEVAYSTAAIGADLPLATHSDFAASFAAVAPHRRAVVVMHGATAEAIDGREWLAPDAVSDGDNIAIPWARPAFDGSILRLHHLATNDATVRVELEFKRQWVSVNRTLERTKDDRLFLELSIEDRESARLGIEGERSLTLDTWTLLVSDTDADGRNLTAVGRIRRSGGPR